MTNWPWYAFLGCAKRAPERCVRHAESAEDETPYQTLTRYGSIEVVVRAETTDGFARC